MVFQSPPSDVESLRALLRAITDLPQDAISLDDGHRPDGDGTDGDGADGDGAEAAAVGPVRGDVLLIRFATANGHLVTARVALADGHAGADGTLLAPARVPDAARDLTPREREVLRLVADGLTTAGVADRLGISQPTVQKHVASIKRRLGATTRAETIAIAARRGLLD